MQGPGMYRVQAYARRAIDGILVVARPGDLIDPALAARLGLLVPEVPAAEAPPEVPAAAVGPPKATGRRRKAGGSTRRRQG